MFQYAHARAWCELNSFELCMLPWIGERVFSGVPPANRPRISADIVWTDRLFQHQSDLIYTRKQVKEWFKFKPEIEEQLQPAKCHCPVLLNVRQGSDYVDAGLVTLSRKCYVDAAVRAGIPLATLADADFETDLNPIQLVGFPGDPLSGGFGVSEVVLPSFYRLMTAPILFRANSTFSWWAATLADNQTVYAPVIKGLKGGTPDVYCDNFVQGNWPACVQSPDHSDLHLPE